jgi:hypothetical protein
LTISVLFFYRWFCIWFAHLFVFSSLCDFAFDLSNSFFFLLSRILRLICPSLCFSSIYVFTFNLTISLLLFYLCFWIWFLVFSSCYDFAFDLSISLFFLLSRILHLICPSPCCFFYLGFCIWFVHLFVVSSIYGFAFDLSIPSLLRNKLRG